MFIDKVRIVITSGDGGNGCISFKSFKGKPHGGPDGGDGGKGGDVIFKVSDQKTSLVDFKFQRFFRADRGTHGTSNLCFGKCGKDMIVDVPRGTIIRDFETGNVLCDMFEPDAEFVALSGGRGGKGNAKFTTSKRKAPMFSQLGEKGMEREVLMEFKTIADVGFVGFPNVGKSTLLSVLTNAKPKIANYHFTTLSPNLGVVSRYDSSFVLADIPGLIEGASDGAGMGMDFLRHIERTRMICHLVDISQVEDRDAFDDYEKIRKELEAYSDVLITRPEIVVANKVDSDYDKANFNAFKEKMEKNYPDKKVFAVSAMTREGLEPLLDQIVSDLADIPELTQLEYEEYSYERANPREFIIERDDSGVWEVYGGLIDNIARNVVVDDTESMSYLLNALTISGVMKELRRKGVKDGDVVRIADIEFDFVE
ncbi:MAG: GTPase ObgE [Bacillota bacterium]